MSVYLCTYMYMTMSVISHSNMYTFKFHLGRGGGYELLFIILVLYSLAKYYFIILTQEGRTPLIAASDSGFADIVKLIIDKMADFPEDKRQEYLDHKKHVCDISCNIRYLSFMSIPGISLCSIHIIQKACI